jgi:hypothetical protein
MIFLENLGDKLGFILAWFSMLPFIYVVSLCTLILFRRDIQTVERIYLYLILYEFIYIDHVSCWIFRIWSD